MKKYCQKLSETVNNCFDNKLNISIVAHDSSSRVNFTLDEFSSHYNPEDFKKGECDFFFKISLKEDDSVVAMFRIKDQLGCAGILVANDLMVISQFRKKGIATAIVEFIEGFREHFGYGLVQATDQDKNEVMKRILLKRGWGIATTFLNGKTNNNLNLFLYDGTIKNKELFKEEDQALINREQAKTIIQG